MIKRFFTAGLVTLAAIAGHGQSAGGLVPADLPKDMKAVLTEPDRVAEDFKSHGIAQDEKSLIAFLENGLAKTSGLPERPLEKSQLIIDAMVKLAGMRSVEAVPVIMRIARFDRTVGSFKIVEYDVNRSSNQSRDDFRVRAYRLIQFNAVNALGLIGDKKAAELVRTILSQEQSPGAQIQYSISLACLGDASGVDYLVNLINLKNRRESAAAAKAFYFITGQSFGFTENSPARARAAQAPQYANWWRQNRAHFQVNPEQVRERRLNPPSDLPSAPRSTRDLLKLAGNYFDFNNTLGSADARKTLGSAGSSLNAEFKRIALDPMEDIDVRMEALNWYFEANRKGGNRDPMDILKTLRKDENPEVADKANTLLEQIAEDAATARLTR